MKRLIWLQRPTEAVQLFRLSKEIREMMFRERRGNQADELATLVQLPDSFDALIEHMRKITAPWPTMPPINRDTVMIQDRPRADFLVILADYGVFGYIERVPPLDEAAYWETP